MDISVKGEWLFLKWTVPAEPNFYADSQIVVKLISPTIRIINATSALRGILWTKVSSEAAWSYFNVSLQFDGYTGKRLTTIFRGRVIKREQGKQIKRVLSF